MQYTFTEKNITSRNDSNIVSEMCVLYKYFLG